MRDTPVRRRTDAKQKTAAAFVFEFANKASSQNKDFEDLTDFKAGIPDLQN